MKVINPFADEAAVQRVQKKDCLRQAYRDRQMPVTGRGPLSGERKQRIFRAERKEARFPKRGGRAASIVPESRRNSLIYKKTNPPKTPDAAFGRVIFLKMVEAAGVEPV